MGILDVFRKVIPTPVPRPKEIQGPPLSAKIPVSTATDKALVTSNQILAMAPKCPVLRAEMLANAINKWAPAYGVSTPLRLAHFFAQALHETMGFKYMFEIWGPTPAQRGYEGRADLGNTHPGDGKRYMGRGIFQCTGRANYRTYGTKLGIDLEGNPDQAADPEVSVRIALQYFVDRGMGPVADRDDILTNSIKVNGKNRKTGLPNGLDDRTACLRLAKKVLRA
jgi:putative chitinase